MSLRWSDDLIVIFGGTFDPPHLGHRKAVRSLFNVVGVKKVVVMPAGIPPLKEKNTWEAHRLAMARLNFTHSSIGKFDYAVEVSSYEIEQRPYNLSQPSYTFDTLQELKQKYSNLAFALGSDQLSELPQWYRFPELLKLCHWIVLERKPDGQKVTQEAMAKWISEGILTRHMGREPGQKLWQVKDSNHYLVSTLTDAPLLSSTEIRTKIALEGKPDPEHLIPEVWEYIQRNGLYGIPSIGTENESHRESNSG